MKNVNKFTRLCIVICFCITLFFGSIMRNSYYVCCEEMCLRMETIFNDAVEYEKKIFYKRVRVISHMEALPGDSISISEREMHSDQECMTEIDPNRNFLDSLFRLKLSEQNMQVESAVRCISKYGIANSCADSTFYENSCPLSPLIYRPIEEVQKNMIVLQGYVQLSFLTVLAHVHLLGFMFSFWCMANVLVWSFWWYWPRYRKKLLAKNKTVEIRTIVEEKIVEVQKFIPVQSFTKKNIFPNGFQFDKNTGRMVYNEQTIKLTKQSLKLFCYFLDVKQSMLTYKDIGKFLFNLDGDDPKVQSRTSTTITRLRESLISFPFIQIEAIRGIGYQLHIDCSEIVETDVAKSDNTDVV